VITLAEVVIKCISRLSALKARYHDAPIIVASLVGQLHNMVHIAQDQLAPLKLSYSSYGGRYHQLSEKISNALDSFAPKLKAFEQLLDRCEETHRKSGEKTPGSMRTRGRIVFLYGEREMVGLSVVLDRQVNALNIVL